MTEQPKTIYLKDYTPSDYFIHTAHIAFELDPKQTYVTALMSVSKNKDKEKVSSDLFLYGRDLKCISVTINEEKLSEDCYKVTDEGLLISKVPEEFRLQIQTEISPEANSELMGLYISNGIFCTQCEPEGFRRIMYFLDRPDVLVRFTTTIIADKVKYPVLLSNGNKIKEGEMKEGKHFAVWEDEFPKPGYLFALVAGDLGCREDEFKTESGKNVKLYIYTEHQNVERSEYAMSSLKASMRWDEEHYGREYDLDNFKVVAVDDFNFGAMENKSLNIFNSKYLLASPDTATDDDYAAIDIVVGHEYFHNWSGNRVTCRDWFQLSLKEGFTVYREQQFGESMISKAIQRVEQVQRIRDKQFSEDSGPMAHPVRPESYIQIDNFYTMTVYFKGAEVIRMLNTLLGDKDYRKATDLYFSNFDGQAATTDDFVASMQEVTGLDLKQFYLWYTQSGTPEVTVRDKYDAKRKCYEITFTQEVPPTADQKIKEPMMIPIRMGLLNQNGNDMPLVPMNGSSDLLRGEVLVLKEKEQTFKFKLDKEPELPSLLRHFSAPVKLHYDYTTEQLLFMLAHDSDEFNRWEASQRFYSRMIHRLIASIQAQEPLVLSNQDYFAIEYLLGHPVQDKILLSHMLTIPSEAVIAEQMKVIDVDAIYQAREFVVYQFAKRFRNQWLKLFSEHRSQEAYRYNPEEMGRRRLKNLALNYLLQSGDREMVNLAMQQFKQSLGKNMTDTLAALHALSHLDVLQRVEALSLFEDRYQSNALVMNKWFGVQARSKLPNTLKTVQNLMQQPVFNIKNPNNVYALLDGFCAFNPSQFHAMNGDAYRFVTDQIIALNKINPQVASRVLENMIHWKRYDEKRQGLMKEELERIQSAQGLSPNVYELVSKSLV
ncbi:MAG: aminopeptidase N [Gammaproteobacteria bacterium]